MINKTLMRIIKIYQRYLSPILGQNCRFHPTCSQYALEALQAHGTYHGSILALKRIIRCNPWGGSGIDNVPGESKNGLD
tara:strand:+ start:125 stop:361 length:237 start_codon:yes stop_codon:yes gene_type:complete